MNKKRIPISMEDFLNLIHDKEVTITYNKSNYLLTKTKKAFNGQIEVSCKCVIGPNELDDFIIVYNSNLMECDND